MSESINAEKRDTGSIRIGMYHIKWDDADVQNDHLIVRDSYGNRVRVWDGDFETVLSVLFIKT